MRTRIGLREAGAKLNLTYLRDGKQSSVSVVIEATQTTDLGSVVRQLGGAQFAEAAHAAVAGVPVESVAEGSAAARLGLKAGDVIVAINRKPVHSIAELREAVRSAGSGLVLRIQRGDAQVFIASQR